MLCHRVAKARFEFASRQDGVSGRLLPEAAKTSASTHGAAPKAKKRSDKVGIAVGADGLASVRRDGKGDAETVMEKRGRD